MKKKVILLCTAAVMIAVLAVGGTLAYLMAETKEATNTFAIGNVLGTLSEAGSESNVIDLGDGEFDNIYYDWTDADGNTEGGGDVENLAHGQKVQKAPKVTLGGDSRNAYVRIVLIGIEDYNVFRWNATTSKPVIPGYNTDDWTYLAGDGTRPAAWYYNSELTQSAPSTTTLFDSVQLKTSLTEDPSDIIIYAELIQSNYLDAAPAGYSNNPAIAAFYWFDNPPTEEPEEPGDDE